MRILLLTAYMVKNVRRPEGLRLVLWPRQWSFLANISYGLEKNVWLTLEQHVLSCADPLICGFFPINTVPVFSFYGSLNVGKVCVWLKSQYAVWFSPDCFSFLPFGEPLISLFVFEAEIVVCGFLTEAWGGGSVPQHLCWSKVNCIMLLLDGVFYKC